MAAATTNQPGDLLDVRPTTWAFWCSGCDRYLEDPGGRVIESNDCALVLCSPCLANLLERCAQPQKD